MISRRLAAFLLCLFLLSVPARAEEGQVTVESVRKEMQSAIAEVSAIVNQPVQHFPRDNSQDIGMFSPGWFHDGAREPDFDHVDVRKTQEFPYSQYIYVSSDLNPDEMFYGPELEFNKMTKFFYLDRSLPKKRLTEAEMVEINRLYRFIGICRRELARLQGG